MSKNVPKYVLGIESTAHTLGVAVVETLCPSNRLPSIADSKIKSNVICKYPSTTEGYIPRKLAEHHSREIAPALAKALQEAGISAKQLSAVAFSQGPGIGHCLHIGYVAAKTLALELGIPLIPVNHAIAHVEVARFLTSAKDPLVVYVSGGNTQIFARENCFYHVYGETMDVGIGNFIDSVARSLRLEPPDAIGLMRLAKSGKKLLDLPYSIKGMNLSFSGILTAIERLPKNTSEEDICFSAQETVLSMLVEATERCLCHTNNKEVLLCGGNARNDRLQEMYSLMCAEHGARFCVAEGQYNGDNAAMIAVTGMLMHYSKAIPESEMPEQKMRVETQKILW